MMGYILSNIFSTKYQDSFLKTRIHLKK